ncbi:MGDG synthase family glycosyltransferase [Petropleomorpha daqingensis]|uniref:UDP-N-acetylglucosamine:LPS N-acetylglucosamine transferase n=1 Tax=Petropleomorpha daqingensis TaxID=2026353 RepID=A0A853CJR3_9ACTN|nr:UDP-N-acetylglucosamine:LPS N-acetylglucosamine transferase [Petropleomorpha daqingensis]
MRTPGTTSRVLIVSGSVGAGHDGAARELAARLRRAGVEVAVRDYLDAVPRAAALVLREGYLATVERVPGFFEVFFRGLERQGLLWWAEQRVCALAAGTLAAWAAEFRADAVVATYPPAAQTVGMLRADGRLAVPAVIYLTDPAAHVSWVHPAVDLHLTVTEATAEHGAAAYGVRLEVGGPLVQARFGQRPPTTELAALRAELGDRRPLALLVGGSLGIGDVRTTVHDVTAAGLTAVVLCGRNETLRRRLSGPGVVALGWRDDVHRLMHATDVLVQNAGGLSFTESLVAGLPAVTYRPIPGHGRANARVLDEAGLAPWAHDRAELAHHLHAQLARGRTPAPTPDPADKLLALLDRTRGEVAA